MLYVPPSSPPSPQTLSTHTLVIVGLLISDAQVALFFPPFCLQKEKHIAFVLKVGTSSLLTMSEPFKGIPLGFFAAWFYYEKGP